jgi:hypothetical protein
MKALSKLNNLKYSASDIESLGRLKKFLLCVLLILGLSPLALAQSVPLTPPQLDQWSRGSLCIQTLCLPEH